MNSEIEAYTPAHAPELISLWNRTLGAEFPMTERLWRQNVDTDSNYAPRDLLVARDRAGAVTGMALTRTLRWRDGPDASLANREDMAALRDLGWILALIVATEAQGRGLGSQLLALAEQCLRARGATRCELGGGLGHFLPGPPEGDTRSLAFWERHGYARGDTVHDLRRDLRGYSPPPLPDALRDGAFRIAPGEEGEQGDIIGFLSSIFPGRWRYAVEMTFACGGAPEDVLLVKDHVGRIHGFLSAWTFRSATLGPSTYWHPALGERFGGIGPLGLSEETRGLGLGLALVAECMSTLKARGVEACGIDWTRLVTFYERLGFRIWRSYNRCSQKSLT